MKKAVHGDKIEQDFSDSRDITIIDDSNQSLNIRIGGVFKKKRAKTKGIWVTYQKEHKESGISGLVLISPSNWEIIKKFIDKTLKG